MLTDNIIFFKKKYPKLYKKIVNTVTNNLQNNITLEQTRNNQKTIKVKYNGKDFYLHSKYDPLREAEAIINKLEEKENIDENSHVIFYGLGLGYHIDIFTQRYPNISFSLYEPSVEVFQYFLDNINFRKSSLSSLENIQCEFESNDVDTFIGALLKNTNKKIIIIDLPIYEIVFKEYYYSFFRKFGEIVKGKRSNLHVNYTFQKRWIINSMKNLKYVLSTPNIIIEKQGEFKDKTAILVAAGPSLNEEIENLRYIKDKGLAYIFSVGSAINTLIHNGIYPHAACTYDPSEFNQQVFKTIKDRNIKDIPMIFGSSVGYETLENYPGHKYHMITSQDSIALYYLKDENDKAINVVQDAPSIAVLTLQLLYILGCKNVILVGQNLGYRGKERYSEGISYSSPLNDNEIKSGVWIKDVYGNEILTNDSFNSMRYQMETYIKFLPNMYVINTTKGGARIEGTEFIELKDIMDRSLNERIVGENGLSGLQGNKTCYDKEYMVSKSIIMDKSYQNALKINKEYRVILCKIEKTINNRNYTQAQKLYVKLDKELNKIENNDFYKTFILPMNRVQYKILADSIDSLNEEKNPYEQGKRIIKSFGNFIDICSSCIEMIEPIYHEMKEAIQ